MTDETFEMRQPCANCGCGEGVAEDRNGQDVVRCMWCNTYAYCRPRNESGRPVRHVRNRPNIKPSQRARIFDRDGKRCTLCNETEGVMHLGHMLSVEHGRRLGCTDDELFSDENLAVMCELCNLGYGRQTLNLRMVAAILQARARWGREAEVRDEPA